VTTGAGTTGAGTTGAGTTGPDPRRWRALAVLALVQFIIAIDNTVVNVALPSIQRDLHFSTSGLAWVVDGYMLTAGGLLLLGGRLGDLLGRRRMFSTGTALFALASLAAGTAGNGGILVASRFLQGVGEALASPAALSLIALLFRDGKERAKALGVWGGLTGIGATVGVLLSGTLIELASWRWLFYLNLPIAATALLLVPRVVAGASADPRAAGRRADVPAAILVTGGLVAVVHGLLEAGHHAWGDAAVLTPLVLGTAALLGFVAVEARTAEPLVPLRFFTNRTRVTANAASVLMTSAMMAMFLLLTLFMQGVLGYSALRAGLAYLPFSAGFMAGVGAYTQLSSRLGPRVTLAVAFAVGTAGMLLLGRVPPTASYLTDVLPAMLVLAVGLGSGMPALQEAAMHGVSERDAGLGSGVQTAVQALGGAVGIAVFVAIALRRTASAAAAGLPAGPAATAGYQLAYHVGALILATGTVLVLVLMRRMPGDESRPDVAEPDIAKPEAGDPDDSHPESSPRVLAGTAVLPPGNRV
jgi:EmrB/QacA subfamily drug resistance transporter